MIPPLQDVIVFPIDWGTFFFSQPYNIWSFFQSLQYNSETKASAKDLHSAIHSDITVKFRGVFSNYFSLSGRTHSRAAAHTSMPRRVNSGFMCFFFFPFLSARVCFLAGVSQRGEVPRLPTSNTNAAQRAAYRWNHWPNSAEFFSNDGAGLSAVHQ